MIAKTYDKQEIDSLEKRYRTALINSSSGVRTVFLALTGEQGHWNAAPMTNVTHVGASPAQYSILFRPDNGNRHTYANYLRTGKIRLVALPPNQVPYLHQCSANYPEHTFEWASQNLDSNDLGDHLPPIPKDTLWYIDMELKEKFELNNGCIYTVGEVMTIGCSDMALPDDNGHLQPQQAIAVALGLQTYGEARHWQHLEYPTID